MVFPEHATIGVPELTFTVNAFVTLITATSVIGFAQPLTVTEQEYDPA